MSFPCIQVLVQVDARICSQNPKRGWVCVSSKQHSLMRPMETAGFCIPRFKRKVLLFNGKNIRGCFEAGELLPSRSYIDEFVPTIFCDL